MPARLEPARIRPNPRSPLTRARSLPEQNATCFLGPHRRYDPFTKAFYSLEPGQGHFGPDAIPGVRPLRPSGSSLRPHTHTLPRPWQDARWRRGESVSLKAARDSMVGLELASQAQMVYQKR